MNKTKLDGLLLDKWILIWYINCKTGFETMLFWRHCIYWGSFLFYTGLLKWRSVFLVGTVYLDAYLPFTTVCGAHVILWLRNAFCIISLYAANTPISRGCFLHYWTFVWQIHWSPFDYSDKLYRLSIFSLVLVSTMWVSCRFNIWSSVRWFKRPWRPCDVKLYYCLGYDNSLHIPWDFLWVCVIFGL